MNRTAVRGGAFALVLGLGVGGCATTSATTVRIPDTASNTSTSAPSQSLAGPVPQDPNPHGVTVAQSDGMPATAGLRDGVPSPMNNQFGARDPLLAGPTPQVPIPVLGRTSGPIPQDPNPHGVASRPVASSAAAGGDGTPTPEPASRHGRHVGPLPTADSNNEVHLAGPVPQDPNPNGVFAGHEPTMASREPAPRAEPAPRESRPASTPREPMPTRGRAY